MSEYSEKELEGLVRKSQKGDADAFAELYEFFVTPIYRYIFYKVKKEDVEDLTETLFLKAWENIRKYKKRRNKSFKAWIFRIAHNLVVDHYRLTREHGSLDPRLKDTTREADPVEIADNSLNNENLKLAIGKLKKNYQQIVLLKFINELSNEEISRVLKKSEGSVRILQFRALKALRHIMDEMGIKNIE
ncbi:sigma-70 family RNA polymerase sigma factor [Patescibacteria group bacterium]